jgi:hypothetical protein
MSRRAAPPNPWNIRRFLLSPSKIYYQLLYKTIKISQIELHTYSGKQKEIRVQAAKIITGIRQKIHQEMPAAENLAKL